jgi:hypothetical protein
MRLIASAYMDADTVDMTQISMKKNVGTTHPASANLLSGVASKHAYQHTSE